MIQIEHTTAAYDIYIATRAEVSGVSENTLRSEIAPDDFERQVHALHQQWLEGEFSFGRFSERIGIPHWELWQILTDLGLAIHK